MVLRLFKLKNRGTFRRCPRFMICRLYGFNLSWQARLRMRVGPPPVTEWILHSYFQFVIHRGLLKASEWKCQEKKRMLFNISEMKSFWRLSGLLVHSRYRTLAILTSSIASCTTYWVRQSYNFRLTIIDCVTKSLLFTFLIFTFISVREWGTQRMSKLSLDASWRSQSCPNLW